MGKRVNIINVISNNAFLSSSFVNIFRSCYNFFLVVETVKTENSGRVGLAMGGPLIFRLAEFCVNICGITMNNETGSRFNYLSTRCNRLRTYAVIFFKGSSLSWPAGVRLNDPRELLILF